MYLKAESWNTCDSFYWGDGVGGFTSKVPLIGVGKADGFEIWLGQVVSHYTAALAWVILQAAGAKILTRPSVGPIGIIYIVCLFGLLMTY